MDEYDKPPLTYNEQIDLLKSRGLNIPNEARALRHLSNISYYRLSAYMLPLKLKVNDVIIDRFKDGTRWDNIYELYVFDRKLRLLVFDAIERLEIAIRTQIIYQLSHKYGSHWQDNSDIFEVSLRKMKDGSTKEINTYAEIQKHISDQLESNKAEVFIQHYRNKYNRPHNPPSWMSVEIMYFNHLSRICTALKRREDTNGIAKYFDLPPRTFCSWLHTINYVRNICAHHARLWNRDLNIVPEKLHFARRLMWISNPESIKRGKLYYFLCMLNFMLQTANPSSNFKIRLIDLLDEYKQYVNLDNMGFSDNWKDEKIWK